MWEIPSQSTGHRRRPGRCGPSRLRCNLLIRSPPSWLRNWRLRSVPFAASYRTASGGTSAPPTPSSLTKHSRAIRETATVASRCRKDLRFRVLTLAAAFLRPDPMTDQWAGEGRKPREVTGLGVLLTAVVVAAVLATMMLWALGFMDSEFVTPAAHR